MKLALGDRVEVRTLARRGKRGTVVDLDPYPGSTYVAVQLDGVVPTESELFPPFWLRKLSLLEVIAEAAQ